MSRTSRILDKDTLTSASRLALVLPLVLSLLSAQLAWAGIVCPCRHHNASSASSHCLSSEASHHERGEIRCQ